MAATGTPTPNIGLRIPQGTDPASVDDINYNSNLLDTKLGAVGNDSVQDQIDALNSNLATVSGKFSIAITNGTNLNNLTSPGFYDCPTGAIAQSLSNCPTTGNFTMIVMSKGSYITQVIFAWGNIIYTRTQTSSGFDHWFQFTGTDTGS